MQSSKIKLVVQGGGRWWCMGEGEWRSRSSHHHANTLQVWQSDSMQTSKQPKLGGPFAKGLFAIWCPAVVEDTESRVPLYVVVEWLTGSACCWLDRLSRLQSLHTSLAPTRAARRRRPETKNAKARYTFICLSIHDHKTTCNLLYTTFNTLHHSVEVLGEIRHMADPLNTLYFNDSSVL